MTTAYGERINMLSNALGQLLMSPFIQQIFAIKSRRRRKTQQMQKFLAPLFQEGRRQVFYGRLLARVIVHRLAKFG